MKENKQLKTVAGRAGANCVEKKESEISAPARMLRKGGKKRIHAFSHKT